MRGPNYDLPNHDRYDEDPWEMTTADYIAIHGTHIDHLPSEAQHWSWHDVWTFSHDERVPVTTTVMMLQETYTILLDYEDHPKETNHP